ncbi:purine-nucleoside phosphorylase [Chitinimonas sp. BJB300]|uniref:purine-nucleoside phosphorylase n=1 Tax=Chitinimonas sp. BJB300 TaxID=1559339 RepID=UPI000C0FBD11|nr:purine nucleoside permease [Chitinimonas sp. BJB300]PHV11388.1 purine nucleoside permease [Chitinimonas sp. BJB300]TSJ88894.1 purine nucleoside permease [Chitinimonas sp. BJB300]
MKHTTIFKMNPLPAAVLLTVLTSSSVMAANVDVSDIIQARRARPVKAMVISMFAPESEPWVKQLKLNQEIRVPGLSPDYPVVRCNRNDVCNVVTGMGYANAAATMTALIYSGKFDLRKTYFLVAGIAGIDPAQGTLGSAAWTRYLVDYGIAWEIDTREMPAGWEYGYFGIATKGPGEKPKPDYRTEVFQLNERLLQKAISLSRNVQLDDSNEAKTFRANYAYAPANQPPAVIQCDTASSGTWFAGKSLGKRARDWVKLMTDDKGTYCTTQQEDNATYEALKRGSAAGRLDIERVAVLRTGADFDRPYAGQTDRDGLLNYGEQGGFVPAVNNLYKVGGPLINDIVGNWKRWENGVPK